MATLTVTLRMVTGDFFVDIKPTATVAELKKACEKSSKLPAASQRLIFKGN